MNNRYMEITKLLGWYEKVMLCMPSSKLTHKKGFCWQKPDFQNDLSFYNFNQHLMLQLFENKSILVLIVPKKILGSIKGKFLALHTSLGDDAKNCSLFRTLNFDIWQFWSPFTLWWCIVSQLIVLINDHIKVYKSRVLQHL